MPAAAPPVAPAASTSTPPTSAPSKSTSGATPAAAAPAPSPPGSSTPPVNDAFTELDRIIAESEKKAAAKAAPTKPKAESETKAEGNGDPQPPQDPNKEKDETLTLPPQKLRTAYAKTKTELKEARDKLAAAEARLKQAETSPAKPEELTKLQERIAAAEKRAADLDSELRFTNYEKSSEYQEKYYEPFIQSYNNGRNSVAGLEVIERKDPDTDEVTQPGRKATADDFDAIMSMQSDAQAAQQAERLFGPSGAVVVMVERKAVKDANLRRLNAIEDYRKKGSEREEQAKTQTKAMREKLAGVFNTAKEQALEKYPQWFKAEETDEQGKQLLETGMAETDRLFSDNKMDPAERAVRHAAIRNKAGAFDYVALKLHRAEQRVAELETELEAFKESEPNKSGRERGGKETPISADEELELIASGKR